MPEPAVEGRALVRRYAPRGLVGDRRKALFAAVDGVGIQLERGGVYGLVGRSGAGKSTLARLLAGLEAPDSGEVRIAGELVSTAGVARRRELRRRVQLVFQDPGGALDPRQSVLRAVSEPLVVHERLDPAQRGERVGSLLASVGLGRGADLLARRPRELSGGERQRVAMARALACEPTVLLLDEPVSALDASVRGQVLNLLGELRERLDLTMMLISHDVRVVAGACSRVGVMLAGRIVEEGPVAEVLGRPKHPYTRSLVAVASGTVEGAVLEEEDEWGRPWAGGCAYRRSCPVAAPRCGREEPGRRPVGVGHEVACHDHDG